MGMRVSVRLSLFAAALLLAAVAAGCGPAKGVVVTSGSVETLPNGTVVSVRVQSPTGLETYMINAARDAVLRDNLGHEYHTLSGGESLSHIALQYGKAYSGELIFPTLDPRATTVTLVIELYPINSYIHEMRAVWRKQAGRFVLASPDR